MAEKKHIKREERAPQRELPVVEPEPVAPPKVRNLTDEIVAQKQAIREAFAKDGRGR